MQDNPKIGEVIKASSIDDLSWFLQILEYQLEETPHHVQDERALHEIQTWTRRVRTMTAELLHNKRVADRRRVFTRPNVEKVLFTLFGAAVALLLRHIWPF